MSESSVWNKLRAKGLSEKATASIMGNMQAESAFISNNVEDRYHTASWKTDEYYTAIVDNGVYSKNDFMYDGGMHYGYGLCQWTYPSRKAGLYDLAKRRNVSISDEQMQIDFLMEELKNDFPSLLNLLKTSDSIDKMASDYMTIFENPSDKSQSAINYRIKLAKGIYDKYSGSNVPNPEPSPTPTPTPVPPQETETCRPEVRDLRRGDNGRDVGMAQWALVDMEFDLGKYGKNKDGVDGDFGEKTEIAVNSLKESIGLDADGVIDEDVWQILFQ